ncbi:MAG: 3'-5' exonuclease [Leptolyngbyaceae bacterium]|nr:3'-5' exonuclease [Leptolyngbyaceae bacterium]
MTQLQEYDWWGRGDRPAPPHLKTRRQLAEIGLKPRQAVGVIHTRKFDCLLYDPDDPASAVPQDTVLEPGDQDENERSREEIDRDRQAASEWAQQILNDPTMTILDTETTGAKASEMVEIAIIDMTGTPLLNTLVKAQQRITPGAAAVHGLTAKDLVDAPTFPEVYPQLAEVLGDRSLLIYNVEFDVGVINYCCDKYDQPRLGLEARSHCLMRWYAQWYGAWSVKHRSYRWQALNGGHRALDDCHTALERLKTMAAGIPSNQNPD